ncbi:MAG: nucleotidyltransferase family protein [Clostridia bacterium]|nr:nucleotidyltransferase family protein [Clostridia bacterium]
MDKRIVTDVLMALVRLELGDGVITEEGRALVCELLARGGADELFALAARHDVAAVVTSALVRGGFITHKSEEYLSRVDAEELAYLRAKRMDHALSDITRVLSSAKIRHTPLKGAVMRPLYPSPIMRMSADVDVLVSEGELDSAVEVLSKTLGYKAEGGRGFHDISLYSPEGIHLELHYNLKENEPTLDGVLLSAEDYILSDDGYTASLSPEFFVFHLFAHLTYHFMNGGCGIKPFVDLYIYRKKNNVDEDILSTLIERAGLSVFYKNVCDLISVWLLGREHTEISRSMEAHVIHNSYGEGVSRGIVRRRGKEGKCRYILRRIFMPYSQLKIRYPIVGKCPILLPVFEVVRWVSTLFGRGGAARRELRDTLSVSDTQARAMLDFLASVGLE